MSPNSQSPDACLHTLGQNAAAVGHLANYLAALHAMEYDKMQELSIAALFDESKRATALAQYGRLELVTDMQRRLEPYVKQQYTR